MRQTYRRFKFRVYVSGEDSQGNWHIKWSQEAVGEPICIEVKNMNVKEWLTYKSLRSGCVQAVVSMTHTQGEPDCVVTVQVLKAKQLRNPDHNGGRGTVQVRFGHLCHQSLPCSGTS